MSEPVSTNSEPVIPSSEPATPSSKPANLTSESINPKSERKTSLFGYVVGIFTILGVLFTIYAHYDDKPREEIRQPAKSAEVDAAKRERYLVGGKRKIGNLIWSDLSPNKMDWSKAKQYCENLSEGGFNDWRLPNIDELRTVIKNCYKTETDGECKVSEKSECLSLINCWYPEGTCSCEVSLDRGYYSKLNDTEVKLWSSSSKREKSDSEMAWIVDFYDADVILHDKLDIIYVRCVR